MTNLWRDLPSGPDPPNRIYTIVEVPNGCSNNYEFDPETGVFKLHGYCTLLSIIQVIMA